MIYYSIVLPKFIQRILIDLSYQTIKHQPTKFVYKYLFVPCFSFPTHNLCILISFTSRERMMDNSPIRLTRGVISSANKKWLIATFTLHIYLLSVALLHTNARAYLCIFLITILFGNHTKNVRLFYGKSII